jgi:hypothetical protein
MEFDANRRDLLLASLLAAAAAPMGAGLVDASPLDPQETKITPRDDLPWRSTQDYPAKSADRVMLTGDVKAPGLYYTLIRWWPGYMSAPHFYATDRYCMVLSGVWYCNSGADFDPAKCVPVSAGGFVHRVARTPHYDGVPSGKSEPAVIAICGVGPVDYTLVDPSKPGWRAV